MRIKLVSSLLVFSLSVFFLATCRNIEDVELLKSHLNAAINESNLLEMARILDKLVKLGVDPKTLPIEESTNLAMGRIGRAYNWETISGEEIVQLCRPLEGILNGTWREHMIRAAYFWGLMETGQREKALGLWEKSEKQVHSLMDSPSSLSDHLNLPNEERALRSATSQGAIYFAIGFVSSENSEDRRKGVELAKKQYHYYLKSFEEVVKGGQLANPIAQAKITQLLPHESMSAYCLVEGELAMDKSANPFLKDQPETNIRFDRVRNTGLEECGLRIADYGYNRIALADYDNDGYADVLIPGHGMWRNLEGSGRFTRVDDKLGLDIKGICGAFVDVNNDGLVDVIVAGPDKVGVSLQTKERIFRPLIRPANRTVKIPGGIGLFDGDGDGLIDVYVSGYESPDGTGGLPDVALRNKGDGTFENVLEAWGFRGDDIEQCGKGVSPGDYDNDGRTDIYVSNYRLYRNTLWRNVSEEDRTAFVQCADAPWFGDDKRPELQVGLDRGVEGLQTIIEGTTYWGHTSGAVWGDLNGDGTLDLVCANLSHPRSLAMKPPFIFDLSRVYLNTGNDFQDHTVHAGLMFRETTTDPLLADFNNDGHLDLSMTNCYKVWVNQLYEGVGDGSFREVTFRTGAFASNACGQAAADFDNDGDLDWFVFDGNKGLLLYENKLIDGGRIPEGANWIELKLLGGKHINGMAYGARVTVKANERVYVREVAGMRGYSSCDDQVIHVGLGDYTGTVDVEVRWIGDKLQRVSGLVINRRHVINEGNGKESRKPKPSSTTKTTSPSGRTLTLALIKAYKDSLRRGL